MNDPAARARYQRVRLRVGILGIGLVLVALWSGLGAGLPRRLDALLQGWGPWAGFAVGAMLGVGAAALQVVPDALARRADLRAGVALQSDRRPQLPGHRSGAAAWAGQVAVAAGLAGIAFSLGDGFEAPGVGHGIVAAALVGLAALRLVGDPTLGIEREPYEVSPDWIEAVEWRLGRAGEERPALRWFDHAETSLAGGWEGMGARRRLTLSWPVAALSPEVAAGLILREIGHRRRGHRWMSCLVSAAWLVLGVAICFCVERWITGPLGTAGRVFLLSAVMTTWCWGGLFVLPALGRRQVLSADRFMADRLDDPAATSAVFEALAGGNLPDEDLAPLKRCVFHPIPPMAVRRAAALRGTS